MAHYERFIASRLRLSTGSRGSSIGTVMAVSGIALAMVIMMATICIVTGFKHEITRKITGFDAHVSIYPAQSSDADSDIDRGDDYITYSPQLKAIVDSTAMFERVELSLAKPAMLKTDDNFEGIVVRGIVPGRSADFITSAISEGEWTPSPDSPNSTALSRITANRLGLNVGDRVFAHFFTPEGVRTRRLSVDAIYDTHFSDYDRLYAFVPVALTQSIAGVDSLSGNRLDLYLTDPSDIDGSAMALRDDMMRAAFSGRLDGLYRLSTVTSEGMMYFNWLALLDTNVVVIMILMALVSGFTLVSSLFIIILERVRMIGLLKALGATDGALRRIFTILGRRLVFAGMAIGNILGLTLMWLQLRYRLLPLDPEAYYLDFVPVEVNFWSILLLNAGVFLIAWAVLLIPGRLIASVSPARSMRYE